MYITVPNMTQLYTMGWYIEGTEQVLTPIPPPTFNDQDLKPGLVTATYVIIPFILFCHFLLGVWVTQHRNHPLLKISQPVFLLIILLGASIGLSSIISFVSMHISISSQQAYNIGKAGIESLSSSSANAACQSLGWLLITGFGLTVPVLILKTWRLHKIIVKARLGGTRRRQHVKELDMFKAIGLFLLIAYVIMIAWTFTTPLYYVVEVSRQNIIPFHIVHYVFNNKMYVLMN